MPTDMETAVVIAGVLIGVLIRTYYPWIKAAMASEQAGTPISFKPKYALTALVTLAVAGLTALQALSMVTLGTADGWQGLITLLIGSASYGYVFQTVLNAPLDAKSA